MRRTPRRLKWKGRNTRLHSRRRANATRLGVAAVRQSGGNVSSSASSNTWRVPNEPLMLETNPIHDTNVSASATQPGHASSAPSAIRTAVPITWTRRWMGAHSVVDDAAKNPIASSNGGRRGGWNDTNVHSAPQSARPRNTQDTSTHQAYDAGDATPFWPRCRLP